MAAQAPGPIAVLHNDTQTAELAATNGRETIRTSELGEVESRIMAVIMYCVIRRTMGYGIIFLVQRIFEGWTAQRLDGSQDTRLEMKQASVR